MDKTLLLTPEEWEMLSPESRHRLNVFVKDVEMLLSRIYGSRTTDITNGILDKLGYSH